MALNRRARITRLRPTGGLRSTPEIELRGSTVRISFGVRSILASVMSLSLMLIPTSANGASYPPSIQPPKVGEPVQSPTTTLESGFVALIPIATSTRIPTLTGTPISLDKASSLIGATRKLNSAAFNKAPVRLSSGLLIGGVQSYQVSRTPIATVAAGKKSEIQTAIDLPTRVSITGLKKNATASVNVVISYASKISLFTVRVSSKGVITLPPLTIQDKGLPITLQVTVSSTTYSFPLRATR